MDIETNPSQVRPGHDGVTFRQAQTPKHCNTSKGGNLGNNRSSAPGGQGYPPHSYPPQGPPPPPPQSHYQRQGGGGPHAQPHYGMNPSPQTPRAPGPPGQGGAFGQGSSSRNGYYGHGHTQPVMISPGGNGYLNNRNDFRGHQNSNYPGAQGAQQPTNNWGHSEQDRYPPYSVGNGNNAVNTSMNGYNQHHQTGPPPSTQHQEYNGGYGGARHPSEMESNHHNRNGSYNNERNASGGHNNMQYSGNSNSNGNYPSIYSQSGNHNRQRHNGPTPMQQPYHGGEAPSIHSSNPTVPQQSHSVNADVRNSSSTDHEFTRAVSSSFGDSVKSKSSDKENKGKNCPSNIKGALSNTKKGSPYESMSNYNKQEDPVDDSSIASDKSWRQLNQVASLEDDHEKEKERQMNSNPQDKLIVNKSSISSNTSSSRTNVMSNNMSCNTSKLKNEPTPSKLASLNDLSSVASIQEPIDTSNSKDDDSVKNIDFSGAPDLLNCASSSGSLLFHHQDESLTKRPREGRGDTETVHRNEVDEEIRGAPSTSPPNVADLSMKEKDKYRPNKKRRNSGDKESGNSSNGYYDKSPSYTFSIESVPSFPKDENKNSAFPTLPPRPGSASSSSLTALEPLSHPEKANGGQSNRDRDGNDGHIPSSMPSWEITGQDSFGGALTIESAGSGGGGGGALLTSFSFNNDFPSNNTGPQGSQGNSSSQPPPQYPNAPPPPAPDTKQNSVSSHHNYNQASSQSQYYSGSSQQPNSTTPAPEIESRNQSFDGMRDPSFDGSFHNRVTAPNRSENMEMNYSGGAPPHHFDSYGKPQNQGTAAPAHRPRSPVQGNFPPHAPSWGASSSIHGGPPQNSLSYNRDQSEPVQQQPGQPHPSGPVGQAGHPSGPVGPAGHPQGPVGSAGHTPNVQHGPYHGSHSGSFGGPAPSPQGVPPALASHHRGLYDGNGMMRNYSQDSGRSSSPGQHYHALRSSSFGGPPPHHHPSDLHLPHAFRPPPPEYASHPHLNRRPPPTVYIVSSPPGGRPGMHGGHPHDPRLIGKGPGGVYSWSKEDDMRLTDIMKKYKNPRDWEPIAKEFGRGKTSKECHERWIRYLKPGVRKGQWQDHEDAIVVEAVTTSTEQPFTRWSDLAQRLPGRVGKQIRDRWVNHLNPNINHMPFSRQDDLRLWEGHKKLGKRWVEISTKYFSSSRSENHIKNRWYSASFKKFIANEFGPDAYSGGEKKVKEETKSPPKMKTEPLSPKKEDE